MKRKYSYILYLICLLVLPLLSNAQPYGNEWIDYTKTYYKFKVGKEGIYRIPKSALDAAGLPGTLNGSQFILYRNGQEQAIYTSTTGLLGGTDYLEFYGLPADGSYDKSLFGDPSWQPDPSACLFTDTAAYFLTYDNQNNHQRYAQVSTPIPTAPPAAETYCLATIAEHYKDNFNPGRSYSNNDFLYSSQFDLGEGSIHQFAVGFNSPTSLFLSTPNATGSGNVRINTNVLAVSSAPVASPIPIKVYLNVQEVADSSINMQSASGAVKRFSITAAGNLLTANNEIKFSPNLAVGGYNEYGTSYIELQYERNYDLAGLDHLSFSLPANTQNQYLEFTHMVTGGNAPKLYDLTNKKWYTGDIAVTDTTKFYIDPSVTDRQLVLIATNSTFISSIAPVKNIQFTNYSAAVNQGNYVIITHKALTQYNNHNYIQDFKDYRSSITGGGYTVQVADVTELYDEYAYGMDMHPLAIKNFLKYAYDTWSQKPAMAFLIGRGILYHQYAAYLQSQATYPFPVMPTYGDPGSDVDFVNFGSDLKQKIRIGRLSIWNGGEVGIYLDKVKAYETALKPAIVPTAGSELWKKNVLHIAGGSDAGLQSTLLYNLNGGASIIRKPLAGDIVSTVAKNTTSPVDAIGSAFVDSMINSGVSIIGFHGHASSGAFDFNLNDPEKYHNSPRLPLFLALGCDVAQVFSLTSQRTLSERYINAANGGCISMLAQDNLGYTGFHQVYIQSLYQSIGNKDYGANIGQQYKTAYDTTLVAYHLQNNAYDFNFCELESLILQGDPAVAVYSSQLPDYHIADTSLSSIPFNVSTSLDSFKMKIIAYNLARAQNDTVQVKIEHINPAGALTTLSTIKRVNLYNTDTFSVNIPIDKLNDLGLNKYKVAIDPDNQKTEVSEVNNTGIFNLFIYSDNLIPVYPQEFAITDRQGITLKASTLNAFRTAGRYKMEIDTTELFNSPLKQETTITGPAGVVKWTPTLSYRDSTVYYWRTAFDSIINGSYTWTNSSFTYIPQKTGWNQSHYYQYLKDSFNTFNLDNSRKFNYRTVNNVVQAYNAIISTDVNWPFTGEDVKVIVNDIEIQKSGCSPFEGTLQVMVFDSATAQLWENNFQGVSGSYPRCLTNRDQFCFEFPLNSITGRNNARHFLDSIPVNDYVLLRNFTYDPISQPTYINDWKADTATNGPGVSLYHTIRDMGFNMIDNYTQEKVFILMRKKGNNNYPVYQKFSASANDKISLEMVIPTLQYKGTLRSKTIGPAKEWTSLVWRTSAADNFPQNDSSYIKVTGISNAGAETFLCNIINRDTNISGISTTAYPYLRLDWITKDTITQTSPQLDHWTIYYTPAPEAALNPAAYYSFGDSVQAGQEANFSVAIEELSGQPMDSMLVKYRILDAGGAMHQLASKKYKKLAGNDTLHAQLSFNPNAYPGVDYLFIEANPDNDQPEQYHPNNLGYVAFKVVKDVLNPYLDVTFDGIHILDKDIVSAKPFIKISLRDENKYLALNDTSLFTVSVRYPSDPLSSKRPVNFDNTTCKFIPANLADGKNQAIIEYRPAFPEDGVYELFVNGKDESGNVSGRDEYRISFEVINKPSITNVLNYPNPFSTATSFLFTVTGSQIPSQLKIQILTVTGKVVKEITKAELGPLHIGRNITQYKWDGKDQYGQTLGNGVYLYRVVTSLNGNDVEHRNSGVDKFFKHGYGKMYIMR